MIIDRQLAQRLEATDALHTAQYAHLGKSLFNRQTAVHVIGDGLAVYGGAPMPINRVVGLGLKQPVIAAEMAEIETFYQRVNMPIMVDFCPLADTSLLEMLRTRRYYPYKMYTVLVRKLNQETETTYPDIDIQPATDEQLWIKTVSQGFAEKDDIPLDDVNTIYSKMAYHHADGANFMAFIDGTAAGSGAMYVNQSAKVAELYSASTRVQFRRRGVQSALIQARLAYAQQVGCDVAMVMTSPGTPSELSLQGRGFQIAYTKLVFTRDY